MIKGLTQLFARLEAIKPNPQLMRTLAVAAIAEQKRLVPRKTGYLGRSIGIGRVTATSAETVAHAAYAAAVELGTKPHKIKPRFKKALSFASGKVVQERFGKTVRFTKAGRLTARSQRQFGNAAYITVKSVKHPGTRAQPFMVPGAVKGAESLGASVIVEAWNRAA